MTRKSRSAAEFVPLSQDLGILASASKDCRGCDLYKNATQTVFGSGARKARVMLVGEQPGDKEDLSGEPFVGPAGALLSRALESAGIERSSVYITNAVKHFKFEVRGKKRIHKKPSSLEVAACRPWLDAELEAVHPEIVVCLGATAAQALLGNSFRVTKQRGELIADVLKPQILATVHPSSILRAPDSESRDREFASFVSDLKVVAKALRGHRRAA
jgi:uracil-DNA glycosylase family protein